MSKALVRSGLLVVVTSVTSPSFALSAPAGNTDASTLSSPGDYSLVPEEPTPLAPGPSAVVSSSVGSGGDCGGAVGLVSGPIGGNTRVFMDAGAGQTQPWRHGPTLRGSDVGVGATTTGPLNSTMTLEVETGREAWSGH